MKRNDLLLILLGLLVAILAWFWTNSPTSGENDGKVVISKDGSEYSVHPLNKNDTIPITGADGSVNLVRIADGKVEMIEANCPDKVCVHTRPAQKDGQSIVCLPNRVVIEIKSGKKQMIDGVSE